MLRRRLGAHMALWLVAACVAACGASDSELAGSAAPRAPSAGADTPGGTAGAAPNTPSAEKEEESTFLTPVATDRFVWVANPKSGHVAYIDATTLEVRLADAGNGPSTLAAVPGAGDAAVVLNALSHDATLLRKTSTGLTTRTFATAPNLNAWAISASGRWAIAWTDARLITGARKTQGFQDVTIVDLTGVTAPKSLAVGYRPLNVGFVAGEATAYAITEAGATIIDLANAGGPLVVRNVPLTANPADDPASRDVSVTPDGAYAFVRVDGSSDVTAVALATGTRTPLHFPGAVTDFDLSTDGSVGVAAMRDAGQVAVVKLPAALTSAAAITSVPVVGMGSVTMAPATTQGSGSAVLYSNGVPTERVEVLALGATPASRAVRLYAPVRAVFAAPDAKHAVVLHDAVGAKSSFSLVPMDRDLPPRIEETDAAPFKVAFSPSGDRVLIVLRSDATHSYGLQIATLPELETKRVDLASPPLSAGIVASAKRAFVAQDHPEGRITFIDLDTNRARTLTGFELGSRVVDGSKP